MSNIELVKQAYQNFAEGNVEAVLANFHPEIEWNECQGFPYIAGDGLFTGPDAVLQNVFAAIPEHYETFQIDIKELFESGDKVVMVGYVAGVWKETGKKFKANSMHMLTVKEGKITHFLDATDTAEIVNP